MSTSQQHVHSILLSGTMDDEAFPIILKYFQRKRKIKILGSQVPHSMTLKIGSLRHYFGSKTGPQLVGKIKINLSSNDGNTRLKIIYDFTKFIQIPSIIPSALCILIFSLAIINGGEKLLQNLGILLIFIPFFGFEYFIKLRLVRKTEAKFSRDFRRFLKKNFGAERISE